MLNQLNIKNFKCINQQSFTLKPLTILTGLNSTGKSTVIQTLLLLSRFHSKMKEGALIDLVKHFSDFSEIRNKYKNARTLTIEVDCYSLTMTDDGIDFIIDKSQQALDYEETLYYLPANRIGQEQLAESSKDQKIGKNGEFIFGYFEKNKDVILNKKLLKFSESGALKVQVNKWLAYILDLPISLQTEKITSTNVKVSFSSGGIDNINPFNLGAGNSYLVKVLIVTLMCCQRGTVLIENPEIHLHPKAQARLGEFLAWVAQGGVQVVVETHSEHLINKLKYQVYTESLSTDNVIIYYKPSIEEIFISLIINERGKFIDSEGNNIMFPSGFFDSTLSELLEIG
jgi:predicted ATPase